MEKKSDLALKKRQRFWNTASNDEDIIYEYLYLCMHPFLFRNSFPTEYNPFTGCCSADEEKELVGLKVFF